MNDLFKNPSLKAFKLLKFFFFILCIIVIICSIGVISAGITLSQPLVCLAGLLLLIFCPLALYLSVLFSILVIRCFSDINCIAHSVKKMSDDCGCEECSSDSKCSCGCECGDNKPENKSQDFPDNVDG